MKRILPLLMLFVVVAPAVAQQKLGAFDYQGLRIGMTRAQVDATLAQYHKPQAIRWDRSGRVCTVRENLDTMRINVNLDKDRFRVNSISVMDMVYPFNLFRVQFLEHYGEPNKKSTDTEYEWTIQEPAHFERLHVSLNEGQSQMTLMGTIE